MDLFHQIAIEAMKEIIRTNRMPDSSMKTGPARELLNGDGFVTPHFIAAQAIAIAKEMVAALQQIESPK